MTIIAKTTVGKEFMFSAKTAHAVSKKSANYICDTCNKFKYAIYSENEKWHVYEIDEYDTCYFYASNQKGRVFKGIVKMYSPYM